MGYQPKEGDIVTINGVIVQARGEWIKIETKCGFTLDINIDDINTICPKIEIPAEDKRRGE